MAFLLTGNFPFSVDGLDVVIVVAFFSCLMLPELIFYELLALKSSCYCRVELVAIGFIDGCLDYFFEFYLEEGAVLDCSLVLLRMTDFVLYSTDVLIKLSKSINLGCPSDILSL